MSLSMKRNLGLAIAMLAVAQMETKEPCVCGIPNVVEKPYGKKARNKKNRGLK